MTDRSHMRIDDASFFLRLAQKSSPAAGRASNLREKQRRFRDQSATLVASAVPAQTQLAKSEDALRVCARARVAP